MKRRYILTLLGSVLPLAGCTAPGTGEQTDQSDHPTRTETESTDQSDHPTRTETKSNGPPDYAEDIFILLQNQTSEQVTVAVTLTADSSVFLEEEVTVDAHGGEQLYSGITERGDYELAVSIDDQRTAEVSFSIEEYALRMGSNIIVWIGDAEINLGIED